MSFFQELCVPAQLYAIFSLLVIIWLVYLKEYRSIVTKSIFAIIWTILLSYLCSKGLTGLSWFLLLFPAILIVLSIILFFSVMKSFVNKMEPVKVEVTEKRNFS